MVRASRSSVNSGGTVSQSFRYLAAAALGILALASAGSAQPDDLVLVATVGPDFTIALADAAGKPVSRVREGQYKVVVHDHSDIHNFVLANKPDGRRVRIDSGVEFVGTKEFAVDLAPGEYGFACSPHWETMNGRLTVVAAPTPPRQTEPKRLVAAVALMGAVSFSAKTLAPATYLVTVRDSSRRANFHLRGPGLDRRTGLAFVGTVTWRVRLVTGSYTYWSDSAEKRKRSIRVR
jgi:hypothetical protein